MSEDETGGPAIVGQQARMRRRAGRAERPAYDPAAASPARRDPMLPKPPLDDEAWLKPLALAPYEIREILNGWHSRADIVADLGPTSPAPDEAPAAFHKRIVAGIFRLIGVDL